MQAVEEGDMIRFSELLTPFEATCPDLTAVLGHLAENFNYSELLSILGRRDGQDDTLLKDDQDDL
jgi:hypothetical protein